MITLKQSALGPEGVKIREQARYDESGPLDATILDQLSPIHVLLLEVSDGPSY